MSLFTKNTSLIIPSRNRHKNVFNLLGQLKSLKIEFFEILVVDSSDNKDEIILKKNSKKFNYKYFHTRPSTSFQRNFGLKKKSRLTKFLMFLDDDIIFFKNAFYEMNKTIQKYINDKSVAAFGFNQINIKYNTDLIEKLKTSKLIKLLGLYSDKPGSVLMNGWHTKILNVKNDLCVDWIYTTACLYYSNTVSGLRFDESFGQYSYLEDLDFSLSLKNLKKKIIVSSKAKFSHPLNIDRSSFCFGIMEVTNRGKIVNKYKLNNSLFFFTVFIRSFFSILSIIFWKRNLCARGIGNAIALFKYFRFEKY